MEQQRLLLERLRTQGHPTAMAETLLTQFESSLGEHRAHLERMEAERRRGR